MEQSFHPGLARAFIRARILELCRNAHEFKLLEDPSTRAAEGAAFALQCEEIATALENDHPELFGAVMILGKNIKILTSGAEPEELWRGNVAESIFLVMGQLQTY